MNARELLGNPVRDRHGRRLGTVEEIVVEPLSGRVSFAVVSLDDGGDSGPGCLPVPWSTLTDDPRQDGVRLDVSAQRIADAPRIAADELDDLERRDVGVEVFSYYGLQPPWEGGGTNPNTHVATDSRGGK